MKRLLTLLAAALLSVNLLACGDSKVSSTKSSSTDGTSARSTDVSDQSGQVHSKVDSDKDDDVGAAYDDTNNNSVLELGHAAGAADNRAVTELVKRYYAAAAAQDGDGACSMIVRTLADAMAEDYGHGSAGPAYLSAGKTCPTVMVLLFRHFQRHLALEVPLLTVSRVRISGRQGLAILTFRAMPERQIPVTKEGRSWKIATLLDSELP
jgi:hypothetical protein